MVKERRRRGASINRVVIELLSEELGISGHRRSNGLAELAGRWSDRDLVEFEAAIEVFEQVDEDLWR